MLGGAVFTDQRKIGLGLTAFGVAFAILGMILFFDRGLIAMGNVRACVLLHPLHCYIL